MFFLQKILWETKNNKLGQHIIAPIGAQPFLLSLIFLIFNIFLLNKLIENIINILFLISKAADRLTFIVRK